jgi:hypothetical protein
MSKVDWSLAPEGATHYSENNDMFYSLKGGIYYFYASDDIELIKGGRASSYELTSFIERPKPATWSGPQDGLPPVGSIVLARRSDTNKWHESEVIRHSTEYQRSCVCAFMEVKSNMMFWSSEYKAIKTPEQLIQEKRETAIREFMDVVGIDCRVTAGKAVDAGFKREVV